jgi:hypothetical protein
MLQIINRKLGEECIVKCKCGWVGLYNELKGIVISRSDDVETVRVCPECGRREEQCNLECDPMKVICFELMRNKSAKW